MATDLDPNESNPAVLWAEIVRLQAAVAGPDGYASWQEAATAERVRRVKAEARPSADDLREPTNGATWRVEWWNESLRMMLPATMKLHAVNHFSNGTMQLTLKRAA